MCLNPRELCLNCCDVPGYMLCQAIGTDRISTLYGCYDDVSAMIEWDARHPDIESRALVSPKKSLDSVT